MFSMVLQKSSCDVVSSKDVSRSCVCRGVYTMIGLAGTIYDVTTGTVYSSVRNLEVYYRSAQVVPSYEGRDEKRKEVQNFEKISNHYTFN